MCNYYCLYLRHPGSSQAVIKHLRENALKHGVQFILYPKLNNLPDIFKLHSFGISHPNFLGILQFRGDAGFFPKELILPGVVVDHLYTQDKDAEEFFGDSVTRFMRGYRRPAGSSAIPAKQPRDYGSYAWRDQYRTIHERNYYSRLDFLNREESEIGRLLSEHRELVKRWRQDNFTAIQRAESDRARIEVDMRRIAAIRATPRYQAFKRAHPDYRVSKDNNVYECMFREEMARLRNEHPYKIPLDNIDRVFGSKPHKSAELKNRIELFKKLNDDFSTWSKPSF